jgi:RNA-directed DNA polymerase
MMDAGEKSDSAIVATKPTNNAGRPVAEPVERRAETEGNAGQQRTRRAQDRASVSQALDRIRQAARHRRRERFTALFHHLSPEMLRTSFLALRREAAPGVDGLTWRTYAADLDHRIEDLHAGLQRGAYRALPSRRRYIPKADGNQRPLAVAALEDKIVQRATAALLNAIYEEEFLGFSYGFRPGRSQHDALDALVVGINSRKVNYILDADIQSFFDAVSQTWLIRFVEHRIGDRRIVRLIRKWLKAGVLEDGAVTVSETGTGQGSVISPLLANVYLHYVFDLWAQRWRRREATGDMIVVRYAEISSSASSTRRTPNTSGTRCVRGCRSSRCRSIRRRPACSSSAAMRRPGAPSAGLANRTPSTSWASPSSAARADGAASWSNGRPAATACGPSSGRSRRSCDGEGTSRSPSRGGG